MGTGYIVAESYGNIEQSVKTYNPRAEPLQKYIMHRGQDGKLVDLNQRRERYMKPDVFGWRCRWVTEFVVLGSLC